MHKEPFNMTTFQERNIKPCSRCGSKLLGGGGGAPDLISDRTVARNFSREKVLNSLYEKN